MKRCVVIADDDPNVISLVRLRLGMAKYDVASANDAAAAMAMVRARTPAAVILDVQMPGGGLSVLAKIKSDPRLSHLPVMMLTGERSAETVMEAMSNGADDYMVKPFIPDVLAQRVTRLVDRGGKAPATTWEI
ncbi:MAG TPA: response regulator [Rhizomicrobium sp.]|nr:response regulator [Rhizomicrobium sp.]